MNLLAFDTSTEQLSIAVARGPQGLAQPLRHEGAGGAQASAALIPAVQALLAQAGLRLAELDAIVFGRGPGSFTGLRTACAVAQGLAFGAGVPVLPVDTLMAVAEEARALAGATQVLALLDARMDQVYCGGWVFAQGLWQADGSAALAAPEAIAAEPGWTLAGNAFAAYGARLPAADQALPLYIRDKVAQTTQERADARAAATP